MKQTNWQVNKYMNPKQHRNIFDVTKLHPMQQMFQDIGEKWLVRVNAIDSMQSKGMIRRSWALV